MGLCRRVLVAYEERNVRKNLSLTTYSKNKKNILDFLSKRLFWVHPRGLHSELFTNRSLSLYDKT